MWTADKSIAVACSRAPAGHRGIATSPLLRARQRPPASAASRSRPGGGRAAAAGRPPSGKLVWPPAARLSTPHELGSPTWVTGRRLPRQRPRLHQGAGAVGLRQPTSRPAARDPVVTRRSARTFVDLPRRTRRLPPSQASRLRESDRPLRSTTAVDPPAHLGGPDGVLVPLAPAPAEVARPSQPGRCIGRSAMSAARRAANASAGPGWSSRTSASLPSQHRQDRGSGRQLGGHVLHGSEHLVGAQAAVAVPPAPRCHNSVTMARSCAPASITVRRGPSPTA